jgi:hypothetical protein
MERHPISSDPRAQRAFEKLCKLGCEPAILRRQLFYLEATINPDHPFRVPYRTLKGAPRMSAKSLAVLDCDLDSWDDLLWGLTPTDLRSFAKRAKKLEAEIRQLWGTPLHAFLIQQGLIGESDLLQGDAVLLERRFEALKRLPEFAKHFGPQKRPGYNACLCALYKYVRECTGGPQDKQIADILTAFKPASEPVTEDALKQWRQRHPSCDSVG